MENDCLKKYLPGQINGIDNANEESSSKNLQLAVNGFSAHSNHGNRKDRGFKGTRGCLSVNIESTNDKIIGKMELIAWNNPYIKDGENYAGYAIIMSSIISYKNNKLNFVNTLTSLKKGQEGQNWNIENSVIWNDSAVSSSNQELKFSFGNQETFAFNLNSRDEYTKEYKKLALWFQGEKEKGNDGKLLGHWSTNIDNKEADLWKNWDKLKEQWSKQEIPAISFYSGKDGKWYKGAKFKHDFGNFDRYNPGDLVDGYGYQNRLSFYGIWVDFEKDCVNKMIALCNKA